MENPDRLITGIALRSKMNFRDKLEVNLMPEGSGLVHYTSINGSRKRIIISLDI